MKVENVMCMLVPSLLKTPPPSCVRKAGAVAVARAQRAFDGPRWWVGAVGAAARVAVRVSTRSRCGVQATTNGGYYSTMQHNSWHRQHLSLAPSESAP